VTRKAYSTSTKASAERVVPWLAAEGPLAYTPESHRHLHRAVPERLLHRLERDAAHREVRSQAMPDHVPAHLPDAGRAADVLPAQRQSSPC
jgi:hypothetical protein